MHYPLTQAITLAVLAGGLAAVHWNGRAIARLLEARHAELFVKLGSPRPSLTSLAANARFDRFISRRRYAGLPDPELKARCEWHRRFGLLLMAAVPLALVGVLLLQP